MNSNKQVHFFIADLSIEADLLEATQWIAIVQLHSLPRKLWQDPRWCGHPGGNALAKHLFMQKKMESFNLKSELNWS
jgi:hypothetical protein